MYKRAYKFFTYILKIVLIGVTIYINANKLVPSENIYHMK